MDQRRDEDGRAGGQSASKRATFFALLRFRKAVEDAACSINQATKAMRQYTKKKIMDEVSKKGKLRQGAKDLSKKVLRKKSKASSSKTCCNAQYDARKKNAKKKVAERTV